MNIWPKAITTTIFRYYFTKYVFVFYTAMDIHKITRSVQSMLDPKVDNIERSKCFKVPMPFIYHPCLYRLLKTIKLICFNSPICLFCAPPDKIQL